MTDDEIAEFAKNIAITLSGAPAVEPPDRQTSRQDFWVYRYVIKIPGLPAIAIPIHVPVTVDEADRDAHAEEALRNLTAAIAKRAEGGF
jgi:hypothetical protein